MSVVSDYLTLFDLPHSICQHLKWSHQFGYVPAIVSLLEYKLLEGRTLPVLFTAPALVLGT